MNPLINCLPREVYALLRGLRITFNSFLQMWESQEYIVYEQICASVDGLKGCELAEGNIFWLRPMVIRELELEEDCGIFGNVSSLIYIWRFEFGRLGGYYGGYSG